MRKTSVGVALACILAADPAFAHHTPSDLGTVRITQPVLAGGKVRQPGTYDIRDTGSTFSRCPVNPRMASLTWNSFPTVQSSRGT